ncbi:hypothetical protein ScPMuIL_017680 [Solemya velum]
MVSLDSVMPHRGVLVAKRRGGLEFCVETVSLITPSVNNSNLIKEVKIEPCAAGDSGPDSGVKCEDAGDKLKTPIPPPRRKKMASMSEGTDSEFSDWEMTNFSNRTIKSPPMATKDTESDNQSPASKRKYPSMFQTSPNYTHMEDSGSPRKKQRDVSWSPEQFNGNINNSLTSGDSALGSSLMSAFGSAFTDSSSSLDTTSEGTVSDSGSPIHQTGYGRYTKMKENGESIRSQGSDSSVETLVVHRLPGENLGMILGVEGGKEGQGPVTSIVVKSVTMGGAAYRATGGTKGICVGDEILNVNGTNLRRLSHAACISVFKEMPLRVTMTIRRGKSRFSPVTKSYSYHINGHPEYYSDSEEDSPMNFAPHTIEINKNASRSLGMSIVPSYGSTKEYYQVKRLLPSGAAFGKIKVGDRLTSCNGQSLAGLTQTKCLEILKSVSNAEKVVFGIIRHKDMEGQMDVTVSMSASEVAGHEMSDSSVDPITLHGDLTSTDGEASFSEAESVPKLSFHEMFANDNVKLAYSGRAQDITESDSTFSEQDTDNGSDNEAGLIDLCQKESQGSPNSSHDSTLEQESTLDTSDNTAEVLPPPAEFSDNPPESDVSVDNQVSYNSVPVTNIDDILETDYNMPHHFQPNISMEKILDFEANLLDLERESLTSPGHTLTQIEESPWEQEAAESNYDDKSNYDDNVEGETSLINMETQQDLHNSSVDSQNVFIEIDNRNVVGGVSDADCNKEIKIRECEIPQMSDISKNSINLPECEATQQLPESDGMGIVQPVITMATAGRESSDERTAILTRNEPKQNIRNLPATDGNHSHLGQQPSFVKSQENNHVVNEGKQSGGHVTISNPDADHSANTEEIDSDSDMEYRSQMKFSLSGWKPPGQQLPEQSFIVKVPDHTEYQIDRVSENDVACLSLKEKLKLFEVSANASGSKNVKPPISTGRTSQTGREVRQPASVQKSHYSVNMAPQPAPSSHYGRLPHKEVEHTEHISVLKSQHSIKTAPQPAARGHHSQNGMEAHHESIPLRTPQFQVSAAPQPAARGHHSQNGMEAHHESISLRTPQFQESATPQPASQHFRNSSLRHVSGSHDESVKKTQYSLNSVPQPASRNSPNNSSHKETEIYKESSPVKISQYSVNASPRQPSGRHHWETRIVSGDAVVEEPIIPKHTTTEECGVNSRDEMDGGTEGQMIATTVHRAYSDKVSSSGDESTNEADAYTLLKELSEELLLIEEGQSIGEQSKGDNAEMEVDEESIVAVTSEGHKSAPPAQTGNWTSMKHVDITVERNEGLHSFKSINKKLPPPPVAPKPSKDSSPRSSQSRSPQPWSPQPRSPQPSSPQPRSPQPRSPQPVASSIRQDYTVNEPVNLVVIEKSETVNFKPEDSHNRKHSNKPPVINASEDETQEDVTVRERIKRLNQSSFEISPAEVAIAREDKPKPVEYVFAPVKIQKDTSELARKQNVSVRIPFKEISGQGQGEIIIPQTVKRDVFANNINLGQKIPLNVVEIQQDKSFDDRMRHDISVNVRANASIKQLEKHKRKSSHSKSSHHAYRNSQPVSEEAIVAADVRKDNCSQNSIVVSLPMKTDQFRSANGSATVTISSVFKDNVTKGLVTSAPSSKISNNSDITKQISNKEIKNSNSPTYSMEQNSSRTVQNVSVSVPNFKQQNSSQDVPKMSTEADFQAMTQISNNSMPINDVDLKTINPSSKENKIDLVNSGLLQPLSVDVDQTDAKVSKTDIDVQYRTKLDVNPSHLSHRKSFPMSPSHMQSQPGTFLPKIKSLTLNPKALTSATTPFKTMVSSSGKISTIGPGLSSLKLSSHRLSGSKPVYGSTRSETAPFQVRILRSILGLGIEVTATESGHVKVTEVKPNGPVAKDGNIRAGDYLMSVNDTDLGGMSNKKVQQVLLLLPRGLITIVASTAPPASLPPEPNTGSLESTQTALRRESSTSPSISNAPSISRVSVTKSSTLPRSGSTSSAFTDDSSTRGSLQLTNKKPWQPSSPVSFTKDPQTQPPIETKAPQMKSPPMRDSLEQVSMMQDTPKEPAPINVPETRVPPLAAPRTHSAGFQMQSSSVQAPQTSLPSSRPDPRQSSTPVPPEEHHKPHSYGDISSSSLDFASSSNPSMTVTEMDFSQDTKRVKDDGPIDTVIFTSISTTNITRIPGSVSVNVHKYNPRITEPSTMVDYVQSDSEVSGYNISPRESVPKPSGSWPRSHQSVLTKAVPVKISPTPTPRQHKNEETLVFRPPSNHGNHAGKTDDVVCTTNSQKVIMSTLPPVSFNVSQTSEPDQEMLEPDTKPPSVQNSTAQFVESEYDISINVDTKFSSNQIPCNNSPHRSDSLSPNENVSSPENSLEIKSEKLFGLENEAIEVQEERHGDSKMDSPVSKNNTELLIDFSLVPLDQTDTSKDSPVDLLNDVTNENSSNLDDILTLTPDVVVDVVTSQTLHDHSERASSPIHASRTVSLHTEENSAINELHAGNGAIVDDLLDFTEQPNVQSSTSVISMVSQSRQAGQSEDEWSSTRKDPMLGADTSCDIIDKVSPKSASNEQEFSVQYKTVSKTPTDATVSELRETTVQLGEDSCRQEDLDIAVSFKSPKTDENFNRMDIVKTDYKIHEKTTENLGEIRPELDITVINSKRKWCILTDTTNDVAIDSGNTPLSVSLLSKSLVDVITPAKIASLLNHANEVLDGTNVPVSDEIVLVVLRDGNDLWEEIKYTEDSRGKIMITEINPTRFFSKSGKLEKGDHLLSLDGEQLFPWDLRKVQRNLKKSKSQTVVIFTKHHTVAQSVIQDMVDVELASKEEMTFNLDPYSRHRDFDPVIDTELGFQSSRQTDEMSPGTPARETTSGYSSNEGSVNSNENSPRKSDAGASPRPKDGSERRMDERTGEFEVTMIKGVTGVGFCIEGGIGSPRGDLPITIKRIYKGGPAEKCGQLKVKDEILKVSDMDFTQMRHSEAWNNLRFMAEGEVILLIRRH